jgi:pyrimidine-nucleoside phosphorylase/thymidine phosphorylase
MAIVWRGLNFDETLALTEAMLASGMTVDLSDIAGPKVDKHSTGGVGDKTSLILAPIVAACGANVPMVSGRGLGHTGGTLDKLESITGFRVSLNIEEYKSLVKTHGMALIGQTDEIAPADRMIYALRDVTATVESIPLITASILSKKLAEGIESLVLDVKTGDGAFMTSLEDARTLATTMCVIGRRMGKRVSAFVTCMDQPLGNAVGNALEVSECVECLKGRGPSDLTDLSIELAAEMLVLAGRAASLTEASDLCDAAISSGSALERLRSVAIAQGGDPSFIDDPARLASARHRMEVASPASGYVTRLSARTIGLACMRLGAGRTRIGGPIDHAVGMILHKKRGDIVESGEPLCTVFANDLTVARNDTLPLVIRAYGFGGEPPDPAPLIIDRIA